MKHHSYDCCSEYDYYDIKNYRTCCTCKYFYDNEAVSRFECHRDKEPDNECYENKFEE
ncbi:MAG: hypothetical protein J6R47_04980 [Acholeplasmatales bacterium]|nr:hypothetical protein [Acholeplasmatales bacterium]